MTGNEGIREIVRQRFCRLRPLADGWAEVEVPLTHRVHEHAQSAIIRGVRA